MEYCATGGCPKQFRRACSARGNLCTLLCFSAPPPLSLAGRMVALRTRRWRQRVGLRCWRRRSWRRGASRRSSRYSRWAGSRVAKCRLVHCHGPAGIVFMRCHVCGGGDPCLPLPLYAAGAAGAARSTVGRRVMRPVGAPPFWSELIFFLSAQLATRAHSSFLFPASLSDGRCNSLQIPAVLRVCTHFHMQFLAWSCNKRGH